MLDFFFPFTTESEGHKLRIQYILFKDPPGNWLESTPLHMVLSQHLENLLTHFNALEYVKRVALCGE